MWQGDLTSKGIKPGSGLVTLEVAQLLAKGVLRKPFEGEARMWVGRVSGSRQESIYLGGCEGESRKLLLKVNCFNAGSPWPSRVFGVKERHDGDNAALNEIDSDVVQIEEGCHLPVHPKGAFEDFSDANTHVIP